MSKTAKGKKGASEKDSILTSLTPPWPVWTDAALNSEKWDAVISGEKKPANPEFEDPAGHGELPASLLAAEWTRAPTLFPKLGVIVNDKTSPCDLVTMNTHLLKSRLVHTLIADISSLMYLAQVKPFPIEMQGPNFVPNGGSIWKPWHHVYSNCKAGKGEKHKPSVNNVGKYVIRLFYLGNWRKMIIDDFIPIDESGKPLLPVTPETGELWLPLLAKALFRIASLSWVAEDEVVDFSVVTCLTGWLPQSFGCSDIPMKYIWCICQKLLLPDTADEKQKYSGIPEDNKSQRAYAPPVPEGLRFQDPLYEMKASEELEFLGFVIMFAVTSEVPKLTQNEERKAPYSGRSILITDADIYTASDRPPTPLWKKFRWKEWAVKTGLLKDPDREVKRVKLFVPIRDLEDSPENGDKVQETILASTITDDENTKNNKGVKKVDKRDKKGGSKKSDKSADEASKELDEWVYLTELIPYLDSLVVYYRPSCFDNCLTLSDMTVFAEADCKPAEATPHKEKGKHKDTGTKCISASPARECFYHSFCFHSDNMYTKKVFFSLSVLNEIVESRFRMRVSKEIDFAQKVSRLNNFHVLGEDYTWSNTDFGKVLFCLGTKAVKTALLQLPEGMCSMRIWLKVPRNFSLSIMSQVPFTIGPLEKIQQLVSSTTTSIAYFGETIAINFAQLEKMFEKDPIEYEKQLQQFYCSYQPKYVSSKFITKYTSLIEEINYAFENAVVAILLQRAGEDDNVLASYIKYLQGLFMRPDFGTGTLREIDAEKADAVSAIFEEELKALQEQSEGEPTPKGKSGKKEKGKKSPPKSAASSRKGKDKGKETLCSFFRSPEVCFELVVKMMKCCPSVLQLYPFRDDIKKSMMSEEFRGDIKMTKTSSPDGWQIFVRFIVNTHSEESCLGAVFFNASLKSFVLRVINNDTGEEVPGYPFGSLPFHYSKNERGYTILAYGIPNLINEKEVKWCLRIISYDIKWLLHNCPSFENVATECKHLPPIPPALKEVRGYYTPNSEKRICRCILSISTAQFITLRFYLPNENVRFHFTMTEVNSDESVIDTEEIGSLVIPQLYLEINDCDVRPSVEDIDSEETVDRESSFGSVKKPKSVDRKKTVRSTKESEPALTAFVIEVFVVRDSWHFTKEEEEKVRTVRDILSSFGLEDLSVSESTRFSASSVVQKRRRSRNRPSSTGARSRASIFRSTVITEAPFWSLQVAVDAEKATQTVLEIDTEREEEIRQMKIGWERADPGRRKRAHALRDDFLEERGEQQEMQKSEESSDTSYIANLVDDILRPVGEVVVDEEFTTNLQACTTLSLDRLERFRKRMNNRYERLLWRQGHCHQLTETNLTEKRVLSQQLLTEAYSERSIYLQQGQPAGKKGSKKGKR